MNRRGFLAATFSGLVAVVAAPAVPFMPGEDTLKLSTETLRLLKLMESRRKALTAEWERILEEMMWGPTAPKDPFAGINYWLKKPDHRSMTFPESFTPTGRKS